MLAIQQYFTQLSNRAEQSFHRYGVVLRGNAQWQIETMESFCHAINPNRVFQLGGEPLPFADKFVEKNKGQRFLGQECDLLVCDFRSGFDANSFASAVGCLCGGGILLVLPAEENTQSWADVWLHQGLCQLIQVEQNSPLPQVTPSTLSARHVYEQQKMAVTKVRKVVEGHRKRPLILTADRGRGKSSALGIASAELIQTRKLRILVTAPTLATVQPIFDHAHQHLAGSELSIGRLEAGLSSIEFIAPDELLRNKPECDLLLVDEASAIPIPMLKQMVSHYHRAVFSTTVHGYEGCGRGFSLKFATWLKQERPGMSSFTMQQPIRWNKGDPLEHWLFDLFLLDAEQDIDADFNSEINLQHISKQTLVESPELLRACFALLVNAHYQTSPSDLMLLLRDESIQLYASFVGTTCIGCLLVVREGELAQDLVEQIQLGKRRPKGHLAVTSLAAQIGITKAAQQSSLRIMRIAVHPDLQGRGIGQRMLAQLSQQVECDFLSTSFGATSELVDFWHKAGFVPVKLGSSREQASGTYSLMMVKRNVEWLPLATQHFRQYVLYSLPSLYRLLETDLVRSLCAKLDASIDNPSFAPLIRSYISGGTHYDSVAPILDLWWKSSPASVVTMSDLVIRKLVQQYSWSDCVNEFSLQGKKQAESQFKIELDAWIGRMKDEGFTL